MTRSPSQRAPRIPQLPRSLWSLSMVAGFGLVGVSAFGLLAAGPRVLGEVGYSSLALVWTVVTIIGIGVATPGEQVITRSIAAGARAGTYRVVRRRLTAISPAVLLVLPLLRTDAHGTGGLVVWLVCLAAATFGWFWLALVRGLLAGRSLFAAYAATLLLEASLRLLLVAAAWLFPAQGSWLLAAAVALPLIMSAALGWHWTRGDPATRDKAIPEESRSEHVSMTAVALFIQVCLSTAQFWLSRQSPDAALSGAFVTAASYMRIPTLLAGGLYAPLLTAAAQAFAERRRRAVLVKTGEALALGLGGSAVLVVALLALLNLGMTILYGGPTGMPVATFVWLGVGTVLYIAASILTNALYGCKRAPSAALAWGPSAVLATALFAVADADTTWLAAASAAGLLLASVALFLVFMRALPQRDPTVNA